MQYNGQNSIWNIRKHILAVKHFIYSGWHTAKYIVDQMIPKIYFTYISTTFMIFFGVLLVEFCDKVYVSR